MNFVSLTVICQLNVFAIKIERPREAPDGDPSNRSTCKLYHILFWKNLVKVKKPCIQSTTLEIVNHHVECFITFLVFMYKVCH